MRLCLSNRLRRSSAVLLIALLGTLCLIAAQAASAADLSAAESDSSRLPRHPLERAALTDPEGALVSIEEALVTATGDEQRSLLFLAKANACRVMGDWQCQRQSGAQAAIAGQAAGEIVPQVRGLIAEARGAISLADMVFGEQTLARAELLLQSQPNSELSADIYLAYSSLSYRLGRHRLAMSYAQRGLDVLADGEALPMRIRLLRNLARAKLELEDYAGVQAALREALDVPLYPQDPKLLAEIHLELARLARRQSDLQAQREHGRMILDIAAGLENTQLAGLGHEVLANAALDSGDVPAALSALRSARQHFAELELASDELRVIPGLLRLSSDPQEMSALALRILELDQRVDEINRLQASADFDIRLQYAEQELVMAQLQASAELAQTRLDGLRERSQLFAVILLLVLLLVATLGWLLYNQRRSNRRLQEVLESRQRALLITSHELRNPIAGVVGLADLLLRSPLTRQQQDMVRALVGAAESVGKLSQDLLDRGRAESGELRLSPHPVSIIEQARDLEQLYTVQARAKGLSFRLHLDGDLPAAVMVDGERLHQVLTNLLSNALKFTEHGRISLRVTRFAATAADQVGLKFEVADTGKGLSSADRKRLFEPFSKGDQGQGSSFGAGLGLSICRDLVRLMGGEIEVHSELGIGTRMGFALQLPKAEIVQPPKSAPAKPVSGSAAVLVVDDDPDLQLLYAAQLKALGCEVSSADGAQSCLRRCAEQRFDLILLDDHLQHGDRGSDLAREIPGEGARRPRVVIVSGSPVPEQLPVGVDEWMTKPMRLDQLAQVIDLVKAAAKAA